MVEFQSSLRGAGAELCAALGLPIHAPCPLTGWSKQVSWGQISPPGRLEARGWFRRAGAEETAERS